MSVQDALILGVIQGLTEFLPVSSSGHLVIAESLLKLPVESLKSFDIATHVGTLFALLVYFWKEIWSLIVAFFASIGQIFTKKKLPAELENSQRLMIYLLIATIPAIVFGVTLGDWLDELFRQPFTVAIFMIVMGLGFFVAEFIYSRLKTRNVGLREGLVMGLAQCLALIPGVSRSGITISAGLVQGVKRDEAAKFSFLLGAIAIFGAAVFTVYDIAKGKYAMPPLDLLLMGIVSSFVVGLAAVSFLMKFLKKNTLHVFGIYRVILGFVILYLLNFTTVFPHWVS